MNARGQKLATRRGERETDLSLGRRGCVTQRFRGLREPRRLGPERGFAKTNPISNAKRFSNNKFDAVGQQREVLCRLLRLRRRRMMSHRRRVRQVLASIVLSGSIVGCSATNGVGDYPCPQNVMEGPQLLYPIPGATGVPDGAGIFVFGGYSPQTLIVLSSPGSETRTFGPLIAPAPTPLPSPIATPFSSGVEVTYVPHGALAARMMFQLSFESQQSGPCPVLIGGSYEFTTQ